MDADTKNTKKAANTQRSNITIKDPHTMEKNEYLLNFNSSRKFIQNSGYSTGLYKGHRTTKRISAKDKIKIPKDQKPPKEHKKFVKNLMREICGFSPYERRIITLLKVSKDKRARKLCKKRLGRMKATRRKMEELNEIAQAIRLAANRRKN